MDLLYHRYASPLALLDEVIGWGQLDKFIYTMQEQINDDQLWEMYLHQIIKNQSFNEWKASFMEERTGNKGTSDTELVTKDEIEATIQMSQSILDNFVPD